jgi:hypothetical protein
VHRTSVARSAGVKHLCVADGGIAGRLCSVFERRRSIFAISV